MRKGLGVEGMLNLSLLILDSQIEAYEELFGEKINWEIGEELCV